METKKVVLPSVFVSKPGSPTGGASYGIYPSNFEGLDVRTHLGTEKEDSVYLDRPQEGSAMLQEFWDEVKKKIYFDVNTEGKLIAIFPEGFDGFLNNDGELILVQGTIEEVTDGIGVWVIGSTFEVQ